MKHLISTLLIVCSFATYGQTFNYLPTSTSKEIVKHEYYTLSYSKKDEQAEWVAYLLTKAMTSGTAQREDCKFAIDPLVKSGSANPNNYKNSGYDKGHLAPAADFRFSALAMSECFYMSNMSPQLHSLNAGIWKTLETLVRNWANEKDSIYVVAAGILVGETSKIPNTDVTIPNYFYKIILHKSSKGVEAIAFLFPHEKATKPLKDYAVSVDSIEKLTHIDFFPALPDIIENKIESTIILSNWDLTLTSNTTNINTESKPSTDANSIQCAGITKAGKRCKNNTKSPNGKCHLHGGN